MSDQATRTVVLSELINGQDTVAHEICLGGGEVGEHKTRAITQDDFVAEMDCLEMLRLTGGSRDGDLLGTDKSVDGGRLSDVGVSDQTNLQLLAWVCENGS